MARDGKNDKDIKDHKDGKGEELFLAVPLVPWVP